MEAPHYDIALPTRNINISRQSYYSMGNSRGGEGFMQPLFLGFKINRQSFLWGGGNIHRMLWFESGDKDKLLSNFFLVPFPWNFNLWICPCTYGTSNWPFRLVVPIWVRNDAKMCALISVMGVTKCIVLIMWAFLCICFPSMVHGSTRGFKFLGRTWPEESLVLKLNKKISH